MSAIDLSHDSAAGAQTVDTVVFWGATFVQLLEHVLCSEGQAFDALLLGAFRPCMRCSLLSFLVDHGHAVSGLDRQAALHGT
jgi:hypothetical protein